MHKELAGEGTTRHGLQQVYPLDLIKVCRIVKVSVRWMKTFE